jgi:hypothetical protein
MQISLHGIFDVVVVGQLALDLILEQAVAPAFAPGVQNLIIKKISLL